VIADLFGLDGRVAIVTGGSSGLGETLARGLAGAGARVAVVARRLDRLERVASDLGGLAVACDLLEADQVSSVVARVNDDLGPPEILVNVAGTLAGSYPAADEPLDAIETTLRLNLVAPYLLCQQVFPHMVELGRGAIVNVSSVSGIVGIQGIPQASYAASKLGLSGLTSDLAVQWARHSIRVNTLAAGFFQSELTAPMYDDERVTEWLRRNTPLPYHGETRDFVGMVLCLTSDAGRYITGQTIVVDGGWTAR
jgi:NAD(P)-dependent dehydrogenase (short-subunit alcohol dehydrogenase family)